MLRVAWFSAFVAVLAMTAAAEPPATSGAPPSRSSPRPDSRITVDPTKTSIYIGSVSLTLSPFVRDAGTFTSDYRARVFPFFFYNEHGHISIEFPDADLQRLRQGEVVHFKGRAVNSGGGARRIEGRAVPAAPGANQGKIKVRVWVGRIELIFNSEYHLAGPG